MLSKVINKLQQCNELPENFDVNEEVLLTPHEDVSNSTVPNFAQGMTGVFVTYNAEDAMIEMMYSLAFQLFCLILIGQLQSHVNMLYKNDLSS